MPTGEEVLQQRSLGVDDDGLFISGPAVVEILHDNRPIDRRYDFALMRVGVLLPQPEVAQDAFYNAGFMNKTDNLHFMSASGTTERVDFPNLFYEFPPGLGRHPPRLVLGHIEHGRLGMALG